MVLPWSASHHNAWCAVLPPNSHLVYSPSVTAKAVTVWEVTKICFTFGTVFIW